MANPKRPPEFLERDSYRRRRMADAARAVPVIGGILVMLPLLWPQGDGGVSTVSAFLYVFALWAVMIVCAVLLSRRLMRGPKE